MAAGVSFRRLFDNASALLLAAAVHVVLLGVLLVSLDWRPRLVDAPSPAPVQAVVLDESRVAEEMAALKREEARERERERERLETIEQEAEEARNERLSEERRLAQVKEELSELRHEHEQTLNLRSREEEERLDELQKEQQQQMERIEQLKREEEDLAQQREAELGQLALEASALEEQKRRIEEQTRIAEEQKQRVEQELREAEEKRREAERERRRVEEQRKLAEAETQRKAEEQRKIEEERRRAEEEERRAEEERRRAEAEAQQREEARRAEEAKRAFESALAEDEEELVLAQTRLRDKLLAEYSLAIKAAVERNWIRPPGAPADLACIVRVSQAPSGDVVKVEIVETSGNRAFDISVENAVWKSSPLPLPKDQSLFSRDLNFVFDPEG